jgi:hypothetical protein
VDGLSDDGGTPKLLVRGQSMGPPAGAPLLFVVGDVGVQPRGLPLQPSLSRADLKRRMLQAVLPVVDLVFGDQTLRLLPEALPWRGMAGASMSSPLNLVELAQRLSHSAGGALVDLHFEGSGPPMKGVWTGAPEGADRDRWHAFERYSADQAARFAAGSLGRVSPGSMEVLGAPSTPLETVASNTAVALPWQAAPKKPHTPWPVLSWLILGLVGVAFTFGKGERAGLLWVSACGLAALVSGLRALSTLQRLLAVPLARVRSMALGPVELGGLVRASVPFPSPHSGLLCAWLRWVIEERRTDSRGRTSWATVSHGEMTQQPFHLDDGTGNVLVQPAAAEVEVDAVVTALGTGRRAREWMILEGGTVFVYGMAQRRSHGEERRALLQERLRESKHDASLRGSLGLPAEGELSMEDWDRVREKVQGEFNAQVAVEDERPDEVFVGVSPSVPLLISQLSRQSELNRLRWRLWGGVVGGGSLLLVALLVAVNGIR